MLIRFISFWLLVILVLKQHRTLAQLPDNHVDSLKTELKFKEHQSIKLAVPVALISLGALTHAIPLFTPLNQTTRSSVIQDFDYKIYYDDYIQYLPAAAAFTLNATGIKGRNKTGNQLLIYGTTTVVQGVTVILLKNVLQRQRPDGSNMHSFPSGHTATAFAAAQFLFREYQDKHKIIAYAGYPIAALTGVCRVLNNRHWVGDVVAGAGIGILSTELAYWLSPKIKNLLSKKSFHEISITPNYQFNQLGWSISKKF